MHAEVDETLRAITERLTAAGVSYFVGGSIATTIFGEARMTRDIDIVIVLRVEQVDALVARLEPDFVADGDLARAAIEASIVRAEESAFNVIYLPYSFKVDLFVHQSSPWRDAELERRIAIAFGDGREAFSVFVASPEDMVLQKLRWYRMTGERSDRQWRDVQGVLLEQGDALDAAYMRRFAPEAGVADLLERVLADAGLAEGEP